MAIRFLDNAEAPPKGSKIRFLDEEPQPSPLAQKVSGAARPALQALGGLGGGFVGSPLGPGGMAGGGLLGVAAGDAAADLLDRSLGIQPDITSPMGAAKETLKNLKTGAIAEATGQAAMGLVSPVVRAALPIAKKAAKFGVDLTAAEIKQSKPWALVESTLEKIPFSAGIIQRFRAKQGAQLERAAEDLIEQIGSGQSKEVVGTSAQNAILQKNFKRLQTRDKLFDRLTRSVPTDAKIGTDTLQESADSLLLKESQLPIEAQNKQIATFLDGMRNIKQQGLSFQGAKNLRERLTGLIGPMADTPEKQVYKQIKNSLDDDIAAFAEKSGGQIEKAWKQANAFHGAVKDLASDPNIKSVLNSSNPGAIVNGLMNSRNTLQIKLLKKAMPEKDFRKVQDAMIDRLFEGGINQTASQALVSNLKKYGDEFLETAIPKAKLSRLREFGEVASRAKGAEKLAGNPSGTAQNVITFAQGAFFISNPVRGTVAVVAPPVMAKLYLSDFGKKLITEGVSISPQSARAAGIAGALMTLANKEGVKEKLGPKKVYADTTTKTKIPTFSTMKEAREASKDLPEDQDILIQGTRARVMREAPGRKRSPGAPKPIRFLESPPEGLL